MAWERPQTKSEEYVLPQPQPKPIDPAVVAAIALATERCIREVRKAGAETGRPSKAAYNRIVEACVTEILKAGKHDAKLK